MARIALVTVSYNSAGFLSEFLDSVFATEACEWMLIVIDNGSSDATPQMLKALSDDPRVTVRLESENLGVAAANNIGIAIALKLGCEHILLLNNDIIFGPRVIAGLSSSIERQHADAIAPVMVFHGDPELVWFAGGKFRRRFGIENKHLHYQQRVSSLKPGPYSTEFAPTTFLLFRRSVFETVGMQDVLYFCYWEDTDLLWRMQKAGMLVLIDPAYRISHKISLSSGGKHSPFTIFYYTRNQLLFAGKHLGSLSVAYALAWATAKFIAKLLLGRVDRKQFARFVAGARDGLWQVRNSTTPSL